MATGLTFALNHMCAPSLPLDRFFALAAGIGAPAVEIRNDIEGQAILDGTAPAAVRAAAERAGVSILSINALQRFNDWNEARAREAEALVAYAAACGAAALVLVPTNDGSGRADGQRQENLRRALEALAPLLQDAGVVGLVEPLGFETSSLRSKAEAVDAIEAIGGGETFRLVHDTFHHHLAAERDLFPALTGLVHISGIVDPALAAGDMRDAHRVLIDRHDRLGNIAQIKALTGGGYRGPVSFEPFAASVHGLDDIGAALDASMRFIRSETARETPAPAAEQA
ncbi:MAG: TIM barrel protein [Pararhizobium sp.]